MIRRALLLVKRDTFLRPGPPHSSQGEVARAIEEWWLSPGGLSLSS